MDPDEPCLRETSSRGARPLHDRPSEDFDDVVENTAEPSRNGLSAARAAAGAVWRRTEAEGGGRQRVLDGGACCSTQLSPAPRLLLAPLGPSHLPQSLRALLRPPLTPVFFPQSTSSAVNPLSSPDIPSAPRISLGPRSAPHSPLGPRGDGRRTRADQALGRRLRKNMVCSTPLHLSLLPGEREGKISLPIVLTLCFS